MSNKVAKLSSDINVITAEIQSYKQIAGQSIFEIGRRLKHVRDNDLAYGEFNKWLDSIDFNSSQASMFIKVYEELPESDFLHVQKLSSRALYEIATLPPEEREKEHVTSKGETKTVDEMTVRELQEVKKKLREEKEEKERIEKQLEQARRSEEIINKRLEEAENKPPKIETRTEYIEVDNTPRDYEEVKARLEEYRNKFGDIENYDEQITASHRQDMIVAVMSFSKGVREFIKRYDYMTKYKSVIDNLDNDSKQQYNEALTALKGIAESFEFTGDNSEVIEVDYTEII